MFLRSKKTHEHDIRQLLTSIAGVQFTKGGPDESDYRVETRENRTLPVLIAPWRSGRPVMEEVTTALTKDFSERGVAVVMHQPFRVEMVVLGMLLYGDTRSLATGEPRFVLGRVRQNVSLGGGYWQLGMELTEMLSRERFKDIAPLLPLTERLRPCDIAYRLPTCGTLHELADPPAAPIVSPQSLSGC